MRARVIMLGSVQNSLESVGGFVVLLLHDEMPTVAVVSGMVQEVDVESPLDNVRLNWNGETSFFDEVRMTPVLSTDDLLSSDLYMKVIIGSFDPFAITQVHKNI